VKSGIEIQGQGIAFKETGSPIWADNWRIWNLTVIRSMSSKKGEQKGERRFSG